MEFYLVSILIYTMRDQHLNSASGDSSGTDIYRWQYSEEVSKIDVSKKEKF